MNDYLYILTITKGMPSMGRGKSVAHGAHAANLFTYQHYVMPLIGKQPVDQRVVNWHSEGAGFGTTIALNVGSLENMITTANAAILLDGMAGIVVDPTYPYFVDTELVKLIDPKVHTMDPKCLGEKSICFREEQTCAYIFGDKDKLAPLLSTFDLLDNDTVPKTR